MPKPILAGYDPDHHDAGPVRFAAAAARFTGAPLIIASAYPGSRTAGASTPAEEETLPLQELLTEAQATARLVAVAGRSAPAALHAAAEDLDAGLLVVGSTHHHGHGQMLHPGSTAERLLHGAPCPVAVVPPDWQPGGGMRTIGAAYVDTPEGRAAVEGATALARRAGARLRVLAAVEGRRYGRESSVTVAGEVSTYDSVGTHENEAKRGALNLVGDVAGLEIEMDVSAQDAADFLVAASERLDLLVCGSRGYGPRRAVLLGGVTRHVTREARCPVIVLARGTETRLTDLVGGAPEPAAA